jgi:co-chaperonin GroES (HSP10)
MKMKLTVINENILVEKLTKKSEKQAGSVFTIPEASDSQGIIVAIHDEYQGKLQVGMRVYYGSKRERVRMSNTDVEVMKADNIIAIVGDMNDDSGKE